MKQLLAIALFVFLVCVSCKQANNVAPTGSQLFLSANPPQIDLNGTSVLTVTGTDDKGASLPDGTRVNFSVTEAGRVTPSSVALVNGAATSTYFATKFSGDITIIAVSGGLEAKTTVTVANNK